MRVSLAWIGLALLTLTGSGCGSKSAPTRETAGAAVPTSPVAAKEVAEAASSDEFPPILREPWKGDLDEMVKRRIVRVLLPFRTPGFFFDGTKSAGILWEAFQEIERLLNLEYKTTDANRIVVAFLPTPLDQVEQRMLGGLGDIAAYSVSITETKLFESGASSPSVSVIQTPSCNRAT